MIKSWLIQPLICACVSNLWLSIMPARADYVGDTTADDSSPRSSIITTAPRFFRPIDPSAPQAPGTTTGTRQGSCFGATLSPVLLAPSSFVGKTTETQPTFTWFLPDDEPVPVEFSLYIVQPSGNIEMQHLTTLPYTPGYNHYQLPAEVALNAEQTYLWQLVLLCIPNSPSRALVYESEVEWMPISEELMQSLSSVDSPVEQATIYAAAGYWYDAIAVLGLDTTPETLEMRSSLIHDLVLVEASITHRTERQAQASESLQETLLQLIRE